MLTNDALPRSRLSPSNIRNARPISRQTIAVVILLAAGLLLFTTAQLFATSMADAELVAVHPMRRAQAAPLWKDDHDVSVVTVYARLAYWAYPHPNLAPDVNLDVIAGANGQDQYLTFEPDRGGFNNIRMQVENLVQIAAATRRVLVLPPSSQWYRLQGLSSLADYYQLDMAARYVRMITMDQYLELIGASIRTATHSPDQIFEFLRHHPDSFTPKWNPSLEALVFQYAGIGERVPSVADFVGNRRPIYYDNDLRSQRNLHFRSDYENGYRLLAVPCTFIYYPTRQWERYGLAILRDGFHYRHDIFDAAASVWERQHV